MTPILSPEENAICVIGKLLNEYWSISRDLLSENEIDFVRFSNDAICPTKGTVYAAGYDLYSTEEVIALPSSVMMIPTDVGFKIPKGYFGRIHAGSSLAMQFTDVGGGVIDSD